MGKERTTTQTQQSQQTQYTPTAEEQALNAARAKAEQSLIPQQTDVQSAFLKLAQNLGTGQGLPGYLSPLTQGINEDVTQSIVNQSLRDIAPQFQQGGILNSGAAAAIAGRTAGDIRRNVAEFNIGNLQNLLNLALSGQAQVQQPMAAQSAILSGRLQGLRGVNTSGSGSQTTYGMNPFLKSFQQGLGQNMGGFNSPNGSSGFGFGMFK